MKKSVFLVFVFLFTFSSFGKNLRFKDLRVNEDVATLSPYIKRLTEKGGISSARYLISLLRKIIKNWEGVNEVASLKSGGIIFGVEDIPMAEKIASQISFSLAEIGETLNHRDKRKVVKFLSTVLLENSGKKNLFAVFLIKSLRKLKDPYAVKVLKRVNFKKYLTIVRTEASKTILYLEKLSNNN